MRRRKNLLVITHKFERRLFDIVSFHRRARGERREGLFRFSLRSLLASSVQCRTAPSAVRYG